MRVGAGREALEVAGGEGRDLARGGQVQARAPRRDAGTQLEGEGAAQQPGRIGHRTEVRTPAFGIRGGRL
jgi:hypothetical protein